MTAMRRRADTPETLDLATVGRHDSCPSANGGLRDRRIDRPDDRTLRSAAISAPVS